MEKKTLNEVARKAKEGFTLIEILVVVAIIGMLGAVAVPAYMSYLADARITTTRSLIKNIEDACQMYNMKHGGKYPNQLSELQEGDDDNPGRWHWHEGNFESYQADRDKRLGPEASKPHRLHRKLTRD